MKLGTIKSKSSSRGYQREKEKRRGKRVKRFKYKVMWTEGDINASTVTNINALLENVHS